MSFTYAGMCSGIGMMERACQELGGKGLWMAESDPFCQQVLAKRFPGEHIYEDVRDIDCSAQRPDVMVFGFPCQDISSAGRGDGIRGGRSGLWSECFRVVDLLRPSIVLIENVALLRSRGLDIVLYDLLSIGYFAEWDVISAAAVGAPHLRERIWIVARPAELAQDPVYRELACDRKGEAKTFNLLGKLPRAGRVTDQNMHELVPVAPRKTKRKDGWSYWVGERLFDGSTDGPLWPTAHGLCSTERRRAGPSGNELGFKVGQVESGALWRTPSSAVIEAKSSVTKLSGRTPQDPQVGLPDQVEAVESSKLLWPSSSRDYKDTGDLNCVEDKSLLPRRVFHVEQGTALLPTPISKSDGKSPDAHIIMRARLKGGPRNSITDLAVLARNEFVQSNGVLYPTPEASDSERGPSAEIGGHRPSGAKRAKNLTTVVARGEPSRIQRTLGASGDDSIIEVIGPGRIGESLGLRASAGSETSSRCWPTPTQSDGSGGPGASPSRVGGKNLRTEVNASSKGSLNPTWVEFLMGIPLWWTDVAVHNTFVTQVGWDREPLHVAPRVASGVSMRSQRLKAIGNSVVWPCAYYALARALAATEIPSQEVAIQAATA